MIAAGMQGVPGERAIYFVVADERYISLNEGLLVGELDHLGMQSRILTLHATSCHSNSTHGVVMNATTAKSQAASVQEYTIPHQSLIVVL